MVDKKKNYKTVKRDKQKQIAFTKDEIKKIDIYSKQAGISHSEFIREGIAEKIHRLENPENVVNPIFKMTDTLNQDKITDILRKGFDTFKKMEEKMKLMDEKLKMIPKIQELFDLIYIFPLDIDLSEETAIIVKLFKKTNKSLSAIDIINETKIDKVKVMKILTDKSNNMFKLDFKTGRWILNE